MKKEKWKYGDNKLLYHLENISKKKIKRELLARLIHRISGL